MNTGKIYVIRNTTNGKCYVGQTWQDVETRWKQHLQLAGKCRAIESALSKYGADAFTFEVIDEANTENDLNNLEQHYIAELNTMAPKGYNLRIGGENSKWSEEAKEFFSEVCKQPERMAHFEKMRNDPNVRKKQAETQKQKFKDGLISSAFFENSQSEDTQKKRSASLAETWKNPELRELKRVQTKNLNKDPEYKKKQREGLLAAAAKRTEEEKKAIAEAISKATTGKKKNIIITPEMSAKRSENMKKNWENGVFSNRKPMTPEQIAKRNEAIKAGWAKRLAKIEQEKGKI